MGVQEISQLSNPDDGDESAVDGPATSVLQGHSAAVGSPFASAVATGNSGSAVAGGNGMLSGGGLLRSKLLEEVRTEN